MDHYSYDRTSKVNFDSVTHKAAEADGKMTEAYLALHSFKAGLDAMEEIPASLKPLYQQVMKALDKLNDAKAEAYQLSMMTRRVASVDEVMPVSSVPANVRVAARFLQAAYFEPGAIVLYGKYKNHVGKIVGFGQDHWGNPTVEIEPIPKGRRQNKVMGLFKIWRKDVKDKALAERAKQEAEGTVVTIDEDDDE